MRQMERRIKSGALFVPIFIGGVFLFTWILQLLWNNVLTDVVNVKSIGFWQAMGVFALAKILFGFNSGWGGKRRRWKEGMQVRMNEKWEHMSPVERDRFREEWKQRCGSKRGEENRIDPEITGVE